MHRTLEKLGETLKFAVEFEKSISQQRRFGGRQEIKSEPVCTINQRPKNWRIRWVAELTSNHLRKCKSIMNNVRPADVQTKKECLFQRKNDAGCEESTGLINQSTDQKSAPKKKRRTWSACGRKWSTTIRFEGKTPE